MSEDVELLLCQSKQQLWWMLGGSEGTCCAWSLLGPAELQCGAGVCWGALAQPSLGTKHAAVEVVSQLEGDRTAFVCLTNGDLRPLD